MADLIDRAALLADIDEAVIFSGRPGENAEICGANKILDRLKIAPSVDALELPCKIGDRAWAIRSYKGVKFPQEGVVSEMYFTGDMRLVIAVKHVARGVWGETVFSTLEEACKAIEERKKHDYRNQSRLCRTGRSQRRLLSLRY